MILEFFAGAYLATSSLYSFSFSLAGLFSTKKAHAETNYTANMKIAVLIPAYKEDGVIVSVIEDALRQQYPAQQFDIILIADSFQQSTLDKLEGYPIQVIEVKFENSTKVKALRTAINSIRQDYDIALILDADNVMEPRFLQKISQAYAAGNKVIQVRRAAKNRNSSLALLDAYSEVINNHIYRKGAQSLGLSAPFIGSGMAFPFYLLKNSLNEMTAVGGFDRELQVKMVEQGFRINYLEDAVLLDEKVSQSEAFGNQRRRWLSSQFSFLRKFSWKGMIALFKGNVDLFNMAIFNNLFLPRVMQLGILTLLAVVSTLFSEYLQISWMYWGGLLLLQLLAMIMAVPLHFYDRQFFKAIFSVPKAFLLMCGSFLRLRGANKKFIHTPHTSV